MYGLISRIRTTPGSSSDLALILIGVGEMPGCHSYIVALDPNEADALWVTEVWESAETHAASLQLPVVQAAIEQGQPLITGFDSRVETQPIGGLGVD
jgi:quinol monooxygenase YgiN